MRRLFTTVFDSTEVLSRARQLGAVQRLRDIHPAELCLALTHCAMGDETRSIATARRDFAELTGFMPEESSFYDRFNEGLVALLKELFGSALQATTRQQREVLAAGLEGSGIVDVEAIDATQIMLPASASEVMPSTCADQGGVKLTATLSVLHQTISSVSITDAKTHDRKALKLPRWLHGRLLLLDRGYADHRLWADIEDRQGYFLTPLKTTTMPLIERVRSGVGRGHVGEVLWGGLRYWNVVDVDASFKVRGRGRRQFRVVRVRGDHELPDGKVEAVDLWLVTNLPAAVLSAEQLATIYRLRWEVEVLFRTLKMVGRLDHLRSANPNVVQAFIYATLLGMVLAHNICAMMRRTHPRLEPSPYRVLALLLLKLPAIVAALGTRALPGILRTFLTALWREGINPNPGRPYRSNLYAFEIAAGAP
jgi:putative transposase